MGTYKRKPLADRFWAKVDKSGECWIWIGSLDGTGYGQINTGGAEGRMVPAHRVSFELAGGVIPAGHYIDHICHNYVCVRPDHLRPATQKQNMENTSIYASNTSGYRGVSWCASRRKWEAKVQHAGKTIHVGRWDTAEQAAEAALNKRLALFTHNDADRAA
jgi:hypothetical protein